MGVPVEFQGAANAKILAFLRERHRAGAVRIAILKVIVSGPEYCGKTCLVRRLTTGAFDAHTDMTDGVEIVRRPAQDAEESIEMVFFDFGGQEVYRMSHRLFLRTRAVFLVMWDAVQDGVQALHEYARDVLDATPEGPLVFASTKADVEGTAPLLGDEQDGLRTKYSDNYRGYHHVSARREGDEGMASLFQRGILELAKTLDHVNVEVPRTYVNLRGALEARRGDDFFIAHEEYGTMARAAGLDDEQTETALMLFDAWGYVQCLPHLDDETVAGPIVLQPEQLATMLSQIITAHSDKVRTAATASSATTRPRGCGRPLTRRCTRTSSSSSTTAASASPSRLRHKQPMASRRRIPRR